MARAWKAFIVILLAIAASVSAAMAYSGMPGAYYPGNQFGYHARYYQGPWGETMVYGGHGYFPNWNGYYPYGYRRYGSFYTPWDMRYGRTYYR